MCSRYWGSRLKRERERERYNNVCCVKGIDVYLPLVQCELLVAQVWTMALLGGGGFHNKITCE